MFLWLQDLFLSFFHISFHLFEKLLSEEDFSYRHSAIGYYLQAAVMGYNLSHHIKTVLTFKNMIIMIIRNKKLKIKSEYSVENLLFSTTLHSKIFLMFNQMKTFFFYHVYFNLTKPNNENFMYLSKWNTLLSLTL